MMWFSIPALGNGTETYTEFEREYFNKLESIFCNSQHLQCVELDSTYCRNSINEIKTQCSVRELFDASNTDLGDEQAIQAMKKASAVLSQCIATRVEEEWSTKTSRMPECQKYLLK